MKYFILISSFFLFATSCNNPQFANILNALSEPTNAEIVSGLKESLTQGASKGASELSKQDGFFKSPFKILLPPEVRKVTDKLALIPGYSQFEDVILEKINRGAEDAVKRATPIFVSAIKSMTVNDALGILMGENDAATKYLNKVTYDQLYKEFNPVIVNSLNKFNAIDYYATAVNKYNSLPLVNQLNPKLDDYVTNQALDGLFKKVAQEELNIRTNLNARTTDLLRKVFAKQDNK